MKIFKKLTNLFLVAQFFGYSQSSLKAAGEVSQVIALQTNPDITHLTELATQVSPALVNLGIYNVVSSLKKPSVLVIGTEAIALLSLACLQNDPYECIAQFATQESFQAVLQMGGKLLLEGATYAAGEDISKALIESSKQTVTAQAMLSALSVIGYGFLAWGTDDSLLKAAGLSFCSSVMLTALTSASKNPQLAMLRDKLLQQLDDINVGKVIGVGTLAGGVAAVAYNTSYAKEVFGSMIEATSRALYNPSLLSSAQTMTRSNYLWFKSYSWVKDKFKPLSLK